MKKIYLSLIIIYPLILNLTLNAKIVLNELNTYANIFYDTTDGDGAIFNKESSMGTWGVDSKATLTSTTFDPCSKVELGISGISRVGFRDILANYSWVDQIDDTAVWISSLNLTLKPLEGISNTTLILGRQNLTSPLIFTEDWNVVKNSYDAITIINEDIKKSTLTAIWVTKSNSFDDSLVRARNINRGFKEFLTKDGVYGGGIDTELIPNIDLKIWYYTTPSISKTLWIQAESVVDRFTFGGQFGNYSSKDSSKGVGFSFKIGYDFKNLSLMGAYSTVEKDAIFINFGAYQTPLYTMGWWNSNVQGKPDTDAFNLTAEYSIENGIDLGLFFTSWSSTNRTDEIALSASKSIGDLDLTVAYIYTDSRDTNTINNIQTYLTYSF